MDPLLIYLILINAFSLIIMLVDKHNAIHRLHRIPERGLWALCVIGGSLGSLLGMLLFRHKTQKRSFCIGFPLILLVHLLVLSFYLS